MIFFLLFWGYVYLRHDTAATTAHKTQAMIEIMVKLVVEKPESKLASKTLTATRISPIKAMTAHTDATVMAMGGISQHMAKTQMAMAMSPAIQANHHPAKDKIKAKTANMAGKMASRLLLLLLLLVVRQEGSIRSCRGSDNGEKERE